MPLIKTGLLGKMARRLWKNQSGVIVIEFAYSLPILTLLGLTGVEVANLAIANMRLSQMTMTIADNLSRAKTSVPLTLPQLREVDINDALLGARIQGGTSVPVLTNGRIVVSSLQQNSAGRQTIKWQRCKGQLTGAQSLYGVQGSTQPATGTTGFQGMGTGSTRVQAEAGSAIIFAEVTYIYQPLVAASILGPRRIRKEAAFYVRDDRDLEGHATSAPDSVYNPAPTATAAACNVYNSTF